MGVMACGRHGCTNIMCDRMVLTGDDRCYICDTCFAELKLYKALWDTSSMRITGVYTRILDFMETPPGTYEKADEESVDAAFKRLTGGE